MAFWDDDEPGDLPEIEVTDFEWVKSALFNAKYSGLTLDDVCEAMWHAETGEAFDEAVQFLIDPIKQAG